MTRDEGLALLITGSSHERLKAARFLARHGMTSDLAVLRRARRAESVSYVKTSLDSAIARLSNIAPATQPDPTDEPRIPEAVRRQIYNQAVEWVAGLILHELSKSIGMIAASAKEEIDKFDVSVTKTRIDRVRQIFSAIEKLKNAATTPKPEQFDLAELIVDIVATDVAADRAADVSTVGQKPLMITSDPELVRLAIRNGLKNAAEAVNSSASGGAHSIIVAWGETDVDYWVSVLDRGPGIVGPVDSCFEIGKTNKKGHIGYGLAIARKAMETLGGTVVLQPADGGGTLYEARWER